MDTTSSAISIVLSDIAIHQDVQEKLWIEIQDKLSADEQLTYDNIHKLEYLGQLVTKLVNTELIDAFFFVLFQTRLFTKV